jgi:acyl-CoA dehydrogenase
VNKQSGSAVLLSDEHLAYRDEVRRFADNVVRPAVAEYDLDSYLTRDDLNNLFRQFRKHEIATTVPCHEDGRRDIVACSLFTEEMAKVDCALPCLSPILFYTNFPMSHVLSDAQLQEYGHLFEPGHLVAMGLSEPDNGSNPAGMKTTARRSGDGWVINGAKMWTSNATVSDAIFVACRVPEEGGGASIFLVDRKSYEYDPRPIPCLGMKAISTCEVHFDDCHVPAIARIGGPGEGLAKMLSLVHLGRVNVSFLSVGIAREAQEIATRYAKERTQFGKAIASFQLVQELLVDIAVEIDAASLIALRAATLVDQGRLAKVETAMAKLYCTEMAVRATSNAIAVHGGMGLTKEQKVEKLFRDARMQTIPDGTPQIQKLTIGRELLGISAFR